MGKNKTENKIFTASEDHRKNDLYLDIAKSKENWRRIAFIIGFFAILVSGAFIFRSFQAKFKPFIVKVNRMGKPVYFGPAKSISDPDGRLLRAEIYEWLTNIRTIYGNPRLLQKKMNQAFALLSPDVSSQLNKYFSIPENDPRNLISDYTRTVDIRSIIPVNKTEGRWKLDWVETLIPKGNTGQITRQEWEAYITIKLKPSRSRQSILNNPLGIHIVQLSWTKISPPKTKQ